MDLSAPVSVTGMYNFTVVALLQFISENGPDVGAPLQK